LERLTSAVRAEEGSSSSTSPKQRRSSELATLLAAQNQRWEKFLQLRERDRKEEREREDAREERLFKALGALGTLLKPKDSNQ
jgi:hypothetical protein